MAAHATTMGQQRTAPGGSPALPAQAAPQGVVGTRVHAPDLASFLRDIGADKLEPLSACKQLPKPGKQGVHEKLERRLRDEVTLVQVRGEQRRRVLRADRPARRPQEQTKQLVELNKPTFEAQYKATVDLASRLESEERELAEVERALDSEVSTHTPTRWSVPQS